MKAQSELKVVEIDLNPIADALGSANQLRASDLLIPILKAYLDDDMEIVYVANYSPDIGLETVEADEVVDNYISYYLNEIEDDVEEAIKAAAQKFNCILFILLDSYEEAYALVRRSSFDDE